MSDTLIMVLICIAVLVVVGVVIFIYYKVTTPSDSDENKALDFINGFIDVFKSIIQDVLDNTDLSQYKSVIEFEFDVFTKAYEQCWDYIENALAEALSNSTIGRLVAKCVTRSNVEAVVELIFTTFFTSQIDTLCAERFEETSEEAIEEDIRLQHEADLYETETKEVPEYVEQPVVVNDADIIPQSDEEEPYNPDDDGMELVDDAQMEGQMEMDFSENYAGEDIDDDDDN